ncbi:MAG: glycosyltransferase, partial [Conexivisphaerales archaeon]
LPLQFKGGGEVHVSQFIKRLFKTNYKVCFIPYIKDVLFIMQSDEHLRQYIEILDTLDINVFAEINGFLRKGNRSFPNGNKQIIDEYARLIANKNIKGKILYLMQELIDQLEFLAPLLEYKKIGILLQGDPFSKSISNDIIQNVKINLRLGLKAFTIGLFYSTFQRPFLKYKFLKSINTFKISFLIAVSKVAYTATGLDALLVSQYSLRYGNSISFNNELFEKGDYIKNLPKKFCLFYSRLQPNKGIFELLEVCKLVENKLPEVQFIIAGSFPWQDLSDRSILSKFLLPNYKKIFFRTISKKKLRNVTYMGYISEEEKVNLLKNCSLFLYPSHSDVLPIAVIEALCANKPVIGYDTPFMKDLKKRFPSVTLVKEFDIQSLSAEVTKVLSDTSKITNSSIEVHSTDEYRSFDNVFIREISIIERELASEVDYKILEYKKFIRLVKRNYLIDVVQMKILIKGRKKVREKFMKLDVDNIYKNLYVGSFPDSDKLVKKLDVDKNIIIDLREEFEKKEISLVNCLYLPIPTEDGGIVEFTKINEKIDFHDPSKKIFVLCKEGRNRSVFTAIHLLVTHYNLDLKQAFNVINKRHYIKLTPIQFKNIIGMTVDEI